MKILIAEHDPALGFLLEQLLSKSGFDIVTAANGREASAILDGEDPPRVAIVDRDFPGRGAVALSEGLRQTERGRGCYIVALTQGGGDPDVERLTLAGIDDVLQMPADNDVLSLRLRAAQTIVELRDELQAARASLQSRVTHDALTGTLNRRAVIDLLDRELARAGRDESHVAVLVVDVDGLHGINEWHGNEVGDEVIVEVSRRARRMLRPYDGIGRCGGDALLVVLPRCDAQRATGVAARIRNCVATDPVETRARALSVTVSVGVADRSPTDAGKAESLAAAAESAAEHAKVAGGNQVATAVLA